MELLAHQERGQQRCSQYSLRRKRTAGDLQAIGRYFNRTAMEACFDDTPHTRGLLELCPMPPSGWIWRRYSGRHRNAFEPYRTPNRHVSFMPYETELNNFQIPFLFHHFKFMLSFAFKFGDQSFGLSASNFYFYEI